MAVTKISNASARAANDAVNALIVEDGGGPTPAKLRLYSGAMPATPETAIGAQVLLAEFELPSPLFPASVQVGTSAVATANAVDPVNAIADGTVAFGRVVSGAGQALQDLDATDTAGNGAIKLANTDVVTGLEVTIVSWTATTPQF